ncbi:hypothetical protein N7495_005359 [Penicillium taxi]|uniref:uncharacterized protein n=1 Tax=Penicillium taxi TaxID=168475 RepID=UPI002544ED9D|nr:uncharacterized protein N7495_005359 [Penicillium taxi]KAJ5893668.1 hypothetical protein N7495_005359 [Penicillium taxi]
MASRKRKAPSNQPGGGKRASRSKLARDNDISTNEEKEISEVFEDYAIQNEEFPDEKAGMMPRQDVRRAMISLGVGPDNSEQLAEILAAIDPTRTGYVAYGPFLSVVAAKLRSRSDHAIEREVIDAYKLFTRGLDGPIKMGHLRNHARKLNMEEDDDLLKSMILVANGGAGVNEGVTLEQFHDVMQRAGLF